MEEFTFAMIKPDAVEANNTGPIIKIIEDNGFNIIGMYKTPLTKEIAEKFYAVHKDKPFFDELIEYISSGPVVIMAIEKANAIADWRKLMGATNPAEAEEGTIRKQFGTSIGENAVHGSDSPESAHQELTLFFS